jgi:hypothetical protein
MQLTHVSNVGGNLRLERGDDSHDITLRRTSDRGGHGEAEEREHEEDSNSGDLGELHLVGEKGS